MTTPASNKDRYVETVTGLVEVLRSRPTAELETTVPATPDWTALDVLRHLSGLAADVVARRMDGAPGPEWTRRQVTERRAQPAAEVLAGAVELVEAVPAKVCDIAGPNPYWDAVVHTADVHEALGLPLADSVWQPVLTDGLALRAKLYDTGELTVRTGSGATVLGAGDPATGVEISDYELFRALFSRRSRAQLAGWRWSSDPGPHLAALPFFGERTDDQPIPHPP